MDKLPHNLLTLSPDDDPNHTFAAVGRAVSEWEMVEIYLSILYSIFTKRPRLIGALSEYGRDGRVFVDRLKLLEDAAARYFQATPNQEHEGKFCEIIREVRRLSPYRHQIAHGVVRPFMTFGEDKTPEGWYAPVTKFALVPPWYAVLRLTNVDGRYYIYASKEILAFAASFEACAIMALNFGNALSPS